MVGVKEKLVIIILLAFALSSFRIILDWKQPEYSFYIHVLRDFKWTFPVL